MAGRKESAVSVPEGERKKGNLEVLVKARDLAIYTTTILSNRNVFVPETNAELIHRIEQCALDIAGFTFSANNIRAGTNPENRRIRYDLQERAITICDEMHMYINVAKSVYHLRSRRIKYWAGLISESRKLLQAWKESDVERYGQPKR